MGIIREIRNKAAELIKAESDKPVMRAKRGSIYNGTLVDSYAVNFDGEKNFGEIGPIKDYRLDYDALRMRSWQSFLESEITQMVINRRQTWVIGKGLKLQSQPVTSVLETENIKVPQVREMTNKIEARWKVFAESKKVSMSEENNLHDIAKEVEKNATIGGDMLVVLRLRRGEIKVETYDGADVCSPLAGDDYFAEATSRGTIIRNGIEMNKRGKHLGYYVKDQNYNYTRIPAYSTVTGTRTAFMVYGLRARVNNTRGLPLISVVLETLAKLDRYKEATVGTAEEVAKIAYQITHLSYSTGENPLSSTLAKAYDASYEDNLPETDNGEQLATKVAATTNKQAYNNPIGAEIKPIESNNREVQFADFYNNNINIVCSALGIPPDVARQMFDGSYSASRAALEDWRHTLEMLRDEFARNFYDRVYKYWFDVQVLKGKIDAPGYLEGDNIIQESYLKTRWIGAKVPHIDPVKEVKAVREKLGSLAGDVPLTTIEKATEELNGGDAYDNFDRFSEEQKNWNSKKQTPLQNET